MDPVFAQHRYGREDILALMGKDTKPPDGLEKCPFFVEKCQTPIILLPLNDTELVLYNILKYESNLGVCVILLVHSLEYSLAFWI